MSISNIGTNRLDLASWCELCEEGGIVGWDDFIQTRARSRKVVHASERVFKLESLTRLNDGISLAFGGRGSRPLDLLSGLIVRVSAKRHDSRISSATNSYTLELWDDTLGVRNVERLGGPVGSEKSLGVVEEGEGLVAAVGHFRDNLEVVNTADNPLARERDRDRRSSEDKGRAGDKCDYSSGEHDSSDWGLVLVRVMNKVLDELICHSRILS